MELEFSNEFGRMVISSLGAGLRSLELHEEVICPYFTNQEQGAMWNVGNFMFPFPGRLEEGRLFSFEGVQRQWPVRDTLRRTALHGFTPEFQFSLSAIGNGIAATLDYTGELAHYPYPCVLVITYTLEADGLHLEVNLRNLGDEKMPYHLGWHPYFNLKSTWSVQTSLKDEMKYDEKLVPQKWGHAEPPQWAEGVDASYLTRSTTLTLSRGEHRIDVHGFSKYWHFFKPKKLTVLSLEPITGLGHPSTPWLELKPGEERTHKAAVLLS